MQAGNKEEKNRVLYITHSGELLIWLIIIFIVIAISSTSYMIKEKKHENVYNILMPDVDGMIVGSPVRMMGIEVGHITKIKPVNDDVYVKFLITNKNITLPRGTVATVEFSGMAGSKSLELYLPDENTYIDNDTPLLSVGHSKRLSDAVGLLNDMFTKLGSIIKTSSYFANQLKKIEVPKSANTSDINDFFNYSDNVLNNAIERMTTLGRRLDDVRERKF